MATVGGEEAEPDAVPLEVVEVEVRRREWDGGGSGGGVKERAEGGDGGGHGRGGARCLVLWCVSVRSLLWVISLSATPTY